MKKFFHKYRLDIAILFGLVTLFWATRLINLTLVPIFTDEAIYIRWSQIGLQDAAWRFIPLTDGKPPLYHWFLMAVMATGLFSDPLVEGRIVSAFSGFLNLGFIMALAYVLFSRRQIAYLTGLIYVLSPFMLVYDRLAIVDSLLTTTSIASLFFAVLLVKYRRLDIAMLFGMSVGTAMLTKASGLIFLLMSPATVLVGNWSKKDWLKQGLIWVGFLGIAAFLANVIYSILRLSQFFFRIGQKNHEFILTTSEFLQDPFTLTWGNLKSLFAWQVGYLTLPVAALIIIALLSKKAWREKLLLFVYVAAPMVMIASFNKIIFARFLLFSTPFLLILAAVGLSQLISKFRWNVSKYVIIAAACSSMAITSYHWIFDPAQARIPQADRDQYFDSWPAGHGINETVEYFRTAAESEPIFIGTQGTFGLMPYSLEIYLDGHPNIQIDSYWPVTTVPDEVVAMAQEKTTYFIYNELENIPEQDNIELVLEFQKTRLDEVRHMRVFRLQSEDL